MLFTACTRAPNVTLNGVSGGRLQKRIFLISCLIYNYTYIIVILHGKSRHIEHLTPNSPSPLVYVETADGCRCEWSGGSLHSFPLSPVRHALRTCIQKNPCPAEDNLADNASKSLGIRQNSHTHSEAAFITCTLLFSSFLFSIVLPSGQVIEPPVYRS